LALAVEKFLNGTHKFDAFPPSSLEEEKDSLDGGDGDLADELHAQCLVLIHSLVA